MKWGVIFHPWMLNNAQNRVNVFAHLFVSAAGTSWALSCTAMQRADISFLPYVSSHGTGTPLGDPIETGALRKAVAQPLGGSPTPQVFTVGAVKSLTGHLEGTAGLAGLMLCTLQLQQRSDPPLRYRNLNPYVGESLSGWEVGHRLPIQASPSVVPNQAVPCAGTSSFSMSGVNAHAIISAPAPSDARRSVTSVWRRDTLFSTAVIIPGHPCLTRAAPQVQGSWPAVITLFPSQDVCVMFTRMQTFPTRLILLLESTFAGEGWYDSLSYAPLQSKMRTVFVMLIAAVSVM